MDNWLSYYHPSTIIFVDDQAAFLTAIQSRLPKETHAMFFNNAQQALSTITQKSSQYKKLQHIQEIEEDFEWDVSKNTEALFNIKLEPLSKISTNPERFSEMSVVIVDRSMPELDGLHFCRELINHPIKKIMLTASKDQSIATKAFNEGIIDFFLLKDSPQLITQLNTAIKKLQQAYFLSMNHLTLGFALEKIAPIIKEPSYLNFIQNKLKEFQAEEYYLLDRNGSILIIQKDGRSVKLVISSGEIIDLYANIALEHEETVFANALSKKEKLLYFPTEADSMRPVKEWKDFLFEAKKIPNLDNIFYALIQNQSTQG